MMQTRRQWHVGVEAPTVEELDRKIAAQDREALDRGYVRKSTTRRDFGAMGYGEALVYEEAPRGTDVAARAEMLGTKPRGPSMMVAILFIGLLTAIVLGMAITGQPPF